MKFQNLVITLFIVITSSGCVSKSYLANEPILVNFATKDYKIEDYGFLGANDKAAMLNVYHAGVLVLQIETNVDTTCIDGKCLSSESFIGDFICKTLQKDALLYVLNAKPIPSLKKLPNGFGFEQIDEACSFKYSVQDRGITAKTPNFLLSLQGMHDAD